MNGNLAMNGGTLSRKALGGLLNLPLSLAGMCPGVPRGSWSGWSIRLGGGAAHVSELLSPWKWQ